MFILIGLLFLALYGVLVFYIGWSGWKWMKPAVSARFKWLYAAALVFLASSFFLGRLVGSVPVFSLLGSYWLAAFSLLLMLLPIVHLGLWLLRLTSLPRHRAQKWAGAITLLALVSLLSYGSFNAYSPVVRGYEIRIDKQAGGLRELNVVMAADMHFGLLSGKSHAKRMVEEINALKPDLVLYPGDIIDDDLDAYLDKGIGDILTGVQATYGVYASLGNHDKYKGRMEELIAALEQGGMDVLYDEAVSIEGLTLIGRKDKTENDRAALEALMAGIPRERPILLMDHQPYGLDIAAGNGVDLMVSGHTHRGQIAPAHLITRALYENDWGHVEKGAFHSIVTSGYGFWGPPIRLGSRSEIVQIHISFADG
ncbi:metallophosphoesterase [Cohnella cellulosilytica]|uniref:Metallophosphoesterase n=1 Tax=Cohnella cellulosilytica TaxID=986710 RepID=A0ABW2FDA2_9BACL